MCRAGVIKNISTVVVGKSQPLELLLVTMSEGHALLEDVPGVSKTLLAVTITKISGSFGPVYSGPAALRYSALMFMIRGPTSLLSARPGLTNVLRG